MSSSASPSGPVSASATGSSVTVTVDDGNGGRQTWELSCSADGVVAGDHPDAQNACAAIAAAKKPWAPVPKDAACTMIYGGPQTATVKGTWDGVDVDAAFNREDGCEIARWDRIAPLLQPGTPAGRGGSGGGT
ncbi:SSI family serine proteinase inhibitor [Kineococcus rhizosphaerae]|uniref:Subtilisin inhibitor-like n=1 Tax=Kineococcus rhizosphaerae TaxID=559628 RepID=A0A2T0QWV1_9ACTN|nr:SSI family serine proteinase inhibitor [Kineococcus rhizosphaerae]PRY10047.1 subtilisin inhibitor-like [Kineococcus rhizosphaerae]